MAAVKLLVKRARFTVSISTFSLCRSIASFSPASILGSPVQFAPLQLPFILATLELVDVSVSLTLEVTAALPGAGSAQAHLSTLQPQPRGGRRKKGGGRKKEKIADLSGQCLPLL